MVNSFNTSKYTDEEIVQIIRGVFKLTPKDIINHLNLRRPIYKQVASYGHFGRPDLDLPWEKLDSVEKLRNL